MKLKKLIIILLLISVVCLIVLGYFYVLRRDPVDFIKGVSEKGLDITKSPKFMYAINAEPANPMDFPAAVLVAQNKIFVSDVRKGSVSVLDYNGKFQLNLKPGEGKFDSPYGLTTDGSNIFVSDPVQRKIFVFDSQGKYLRIFATSQEMGGPGVILFNKNKLYVSDQPKHKVLEFDMNGNLLKSFGSEGHEKDQLYFPHGLAVDEKENVYVADAGNERIQVFSADGKYLKSIGSDLLTPRGLFRDKQGNLWVVSGMANKIQIYSPEGNKISEFGTYGPDYGQIALPNGIFLDQNNRLYITEVGNSRVSVFGY